MRRGIIGEDERGLISLLCPRGGWLAQARGRGGHTHRRRRLGCSRRAGHGDARHAWSWLRRSMLRPSRAGECRQMGPACCASPAGSRWLQSPRGEIWANCSCYTAPALRRGLHCRQQQVRRAPRVVARRPPLGPPRAATGPCRSLMAAIGRRSGIATAGGPAAAARPPCAHLPHLPCPAPAALERGPQSTGMARSGIGRRVAAAALLLGVALAALAAPAAAQEWDGTDPDTGYREDGELPWNVRGTTIPGLKSDVEVEVAQQMLDGFLSVANEINTGERDDSFTIQAAPQVRGPACPAEQALLTLSTACHTQRGSVCVERGQGGCACARRSPALPPGCSRFPSCRPRPACLPLPRPASSSSPARWTWPTSRPRCLVRLWPAGRWAWSRRPATGASSPRSLRSTTVSTTTRQELGSNVCFTCRLGGALMASLGIASGGREAAVHNCVAAGALPAHDCPDSPKRCPPTTRLPFQPAPVPADS